MNSKKEQQCVNNPEPQKFFLHNKFKLGKFHYYAISPARRTFVLLLAKLLYMLGSGQF